MSRVQQSSQKNYFENGRFSINYRDHGWPPEELRLARGEIHCHSSVRVDVAELIGSRTRQQDVDLKTVKLTLLSSVRKLYGQLGVAMYDFDVLHAYDRECRFLLHVQAQYLRRILCAITFVTLLNDRPCKIDTEAVASSLIALGGKLKRTIS